MDETKRKPIKRNNLPVGIILTSLLILISFSACQGPFDLKTALGLELNTLAISPNGIVVDKDIGPVTFTASPAGSYIWSVISGTGGIDSATGIYTPSGLVEYITIQAEDLSTGEYGRARIRFEDGVDLRLLAQVQTLYPGDTTPLYAYGGNGSGYTYSVSVNNSGANPLVGPSYTAGPNPGTDTLMVQDAGAENSDALTITVLDPALSIPDINYNVDSVSVNTSPTQLGAAVDAEFVYSNIGTAGGGTNVSWTAYASTNTGLSGIVKQLDSGTVLSLAGLSTAAVPQPIAGTWPDQPGSYSIVVQMTPESDVDPANNTGSSGAQTITVSDVDYSPVSGPAGGSVTVNTALSGVSFTIENVGTDTGSAPVEWTAWLSSDTTPGNAGDVQLDNGSTGFLGPNPPGPDSGPINISGTWSVPQGSYWLIVTWEASDDINSTNDKVISTVQYQVQAADVDYEINTAPMGDPDPLTGSSLTDSFILENTGLEDGAADIEWTAWISTDGTIDALDSQLNWGIISGGIQSSLTAGDSIIGNWPDMAGNYNIILEWSANDEADSSNNEVVVGPFTVRDPVTDYTVNSVADPAVSANSGSVVSGTFAIQNFGGDDDSAGYDWSVYASSDQLYNSGDALIDNGFETGRTVASLDGTVAYSGLWPEISGDYYIVVIVDALYDTDVPYSSIAASVNTCSVSNQTDYSIENVNFVSTGIPGAPLSAGTNDFTITENSGVAGNKKVEYSVYASNDTVLDAGDAVLKSGFEQANNIGAGGSQLVVFNDGNPWPIFPAEYYIIITISAADDSDASNNLLISGPVTAPDVVTEVNDNGNNDYNDGYYDIGPPLKTPIAKHHNLDTDLQASELRPNELIHIQGIMDPYDEYDTYGFTAGAGMTSFLASADWATGFDDIDLFFWDEATWDQSSSLRVTPDTEGNIYVTDLVPGNRYYIAVNFWLEGNTSGSELVESYTLVIKGLP